MAAGQVLEGELLESLDVPIGTPDPAEFCCTTFSSLILKYRPDAKAWSYIPPPSGIGHGTCSYVTSVTGHKVLAGGASGVKGQTPTPGKGSSKAGRCIFFDKDSPLTHIKEVRSCVHACVRACCVLRAL